MGEVKEEAKWIIHDLFGPVNAQKLDIMDDSNPIIFLNQVKDIISGMLGPKIAEQKMAKLYKKYA